MLKDVYDPLTAYAEVFRGRFEEVAKTTFAELADEAKVDVEANRETCCQLHATEEILNTTKSSIGWWKFFRFILWGMLIAGAIVVVGYHDELEPWQLITIIVAVLVAVCLLFLMVNPRLETLKDERDVLAETVRHLTIVAWGQMEPLNRLYDWDVFTRMMSKTVPRLEFDPFFTTQRLAELQSVYGWDGSFNAERSVLYAHSGRINGNPFVICRTRKMEMGTKTYTGSKIINWTTREMGSDGKYHSVRHSEVLRASVTAPYPYYFEKTRLIYGNTAAPDLIFSRKQNGLAGRENSLSYKWHRRRLRKRARDLKNADFAMLTNEDFEVAFDTRNRNNNQQYALLFTPLAQESMMKLLQDEEYGYGDDFDFYKERMINTVISEHMQTLELDMCPVQYFDYEFDKAQQKFCELNADYFRAIYFNMAPLLCVPMYQQIRSHQDIYGRSMKSVSSFWEHEALANYWGQAKFMHPACVTDCILKTEQHRISDDDSSITVYAYGFRCEQRLAYIEKFGGDGRYHRVPVYWDEYLPVMGEGHIQMHEDHQMLEEGISARERLNHISEVLNNASCKVYRRHIASRA